MSITTQHRPSRFPYGIYSTYMALECDKMPTIYFTKRTLCETCWLELGNLCRLIPKALEGDDGRLDTCNSFTHKPFDHDEESPV